MWCNLHLRGKKRKGLAYKATSTEDGGYLIEDKRWSLPTAAKTATAPEDEVQEITIEMKEEKAIPSGNKIISNEAEFFFGGGGDWWEGYFVYGWSTCNQFWFIYCFVTSPGMLLNYK